ncbi:hypothetical protein [Endozoicomonas ascidiicola]|uniref:hypothetical protein n=1 Tax=Endozoicomonas ascidiicola TaxID=1698521 RepID=UPI00082E5C26|nr:hypothetical protein [Endozoicomonas ascidiicola]
MEEIRILQEIASNTATDNSVWVAAVSAAAAILGATVSAIISYLVTGRTIKSQERLEHKRLRASIVTNERLRWLQDIRTRLSELYVKLDSQYTLIKRPLETASAQEIQVMLDEYSAEIMLETHMITLMLNDKDQEQIALKSELQAALSFMQDCFQQTRQEEQSFDDGQYAIIKERIIKLATLIGSETWSQISNLE